jgi:acyl-CoA synthetase (AMP-forming)/AMP-acid ligase II
LTFDTCVRRFIIIAIGLGAASCQSSRPFEPPVAEQPVKQMPPVDIGLDQILHVGMSREEVMAVLPIFPNLGCGTIMNMHFIGTSRLYPGYLIELDEHNELDGVYRLKSWAAYQWPPKG